MSKIENYTDLIVYTKAYGLAMEVFAVSTGFPKEEKYSLTDQIRRSSRSVTASLAEAWAKRRYQKVFINKLTDCLGEANETTVWLDYSKDCDYMSTEMHLKLKNENEEVCKMLISMINNSDKWCPK